MNSIAKGFLKECRHMFPFYGKKEKIFFTHLKEGLITYCDSHDNANYNDIIEEFGSPKSIMESYIASCESQYILKKMKIRSLLKTLGIITTSCLLAIALLELYTINQMKTEKV